MTIGDLRERLTLLSPVLVDDGQGGQTISDWTDGDEVAAAVVPVGSRESIALGGQQASLQVRITIRYRTGVSSPMRVRRGRDQQVYELMGPPRDVDGRRRWLELDASEVRA